METITCPLCASSNSRLVFKRKDWVFQVSEEAFCVVRCHNCGLVYVNPRPAEEEIHDYYTEEFYDTTITGTDLLKRNAQQLQLKYRYVCDIAPGKLLDIGCGKGDFLFYMQQKGWQVRGMDFSSKPPNLFDLDIFYGDLASATYPPASFDLVTAWAVLEHVYRPLQMLKQANQLLKPGGKIVVLVSNFDSLPAWFMRQDDVPRHTTLFTARTLGEMLHRAGFAMDYVECNNGLYGGSNRGVLNYLVKLIAGEKIDDIVAMNRSRDRWHEFSNYLRGKPSDFMLKVDRLDLALTPHLDHWLDKLRLGYIMIAQAVKK